jgi:hypothetical protein
VARAPETDTVDGRLRRAMAHMNLHFAGSQSRNGTASGILLAAAAIWGRTAHLQGPSESLLLFYHCRWPSPR